MTEIRRYWPWLMLVLVAHVAEQLLFGIDELYELKGRLGLVLGQFPDPDYAIVGLVGLVVILVMGLIYGQLMGGRGRLIAPTFFGIAGLIESHHIWKTIIRLRYFPGAVTAVPFVVVGFLLLRAVRRELQQPAAPA